MPKAQKPKTKIMVFGTFDVLHQGHINFFKQARKLSGSPFLIVSVARDINVKKIKGQKPLRSEKQRLSAVKKNQFVNHAVLGGVKNHLNHILERQPKIIALGYDQVAYVKGLKTDLAKMGLKVKIVRLKAHKPKFFKSSILKLARTS